MPSPLTLILLGLLTPATAAPLIKRDDDYAVPQPVIILLIMLGAGLLVCMGYAIHSMFVPKPEGVKQITNEQMEYMAEVRIRNMDRLLAEGRRSHKGAMRGGGDTVYD